MKLKLVNVFWRECGWPLYMGWETALLHEDQVRSWVRNTVRSVRQMPGVHSVRVKVLGDPR